MESTSIPIALREQAGAARAHSADVAVRVLTPFDLCGEALLIACLLTSPWAYGAVEDSVRYALCASLFAASFLLSWPDLRGQRVGRGASWATCIPAFAGFQVAMSRSLDPWGTADVALVGFAMAVIWVAVDARCGSTSPNSSRRIAAAILLVCLAEAVFAAAQWSADRTALFGRKGPLQTTPFGSYMNHNNFAGLVSLGVPLSAAMAIGSLGRSGRLTPRSLLLIGLTAGLVVTVFASGSRGGSLAMILGVATLWPLSRLRRHPTPVDPRPWFLLALLVVIVGFFSLPATSRARLLNVAAEGGSVAYRIDITKASVRAFAERPLLGSGLGAFGDAATPFKTSNGDVRSDRAEADALEFAVEGGVALVALIGAFAAFVWRSVKFEAKSDRSRSGRWLRIGSLGACTTMLFHSLFDFGFRIPANALSFCVLLGIATATASAPSRPRKFGAPLFAAALILGMGLSAYRSAGAASERFALLRSTPESRLDALQPLLESHPYLVGARRQRALAWMSLAYSRGSYDSARLARAQSDLESVISSRPQWGVAWADLAWCRYFLGNTAEAKEAMKSAVRFDPTHLGVGIGSAQLLAWSGDLVGAVSRVAELRKLNPTWSRASARELVASWTRDPSVVSGVP